MSASEPSDDSTVAVREFDTDAADPNVEVVSAVADLEEVPAAELPALYRCIDHIIENLFTEPPAAEADVTVTFSYHGYRITIDQDGTARFEPLD